MSCIAGIINLDGCPADPELLERMTGVMSPRAPDALNIWTSGPVGFGHAMLRTSAVSQREHQPFTLDGKVWVCADARIDGREELVNKLRASGAQFDADATDPELILQSYQTIGDDFLDYLIGDFAFAIWDARSRRLICARDHFGVRPFFYVRTRDHFLFASHINALRQHLAVPDQLDEGFIADMLLFGGCLDAEASAFSGIRRLPGSAKLILEEGRTEIRNYWKLPEYHERAKASDEEYIEEFSALFTQAVTERAGAVGTAIELSGGMDSGAIAATLRSGEPGNSKKVLAYSVSCSNLFEDDENEFTKLTASSLGVELEFQQLADYYLFQDQQYYEKSEEPQTNPNMAVHCDKWNRISSQGVRVVLSGQGGDEAFGTTFLNPARRFEVGALLELSGNVWRRIIRLGTIRGAGIRAHFGWARSGQKWRPPIPAWIAPEFARRLDISDRWHNGWQRINSGVSVHRQLNSGILSSLFEGYERPEIPLLVRHPFFDVRLVCFLTKLPNRLKANKWLLRKAMAGKLPGRICARPKTALAGDVVRSQLMKRNDSHILKQWVSNECAEYVDGVSFAIGFDQYMAGYGSQSTWSSALLVTPLCLSLWLKGHCLET